MTSLRYLSKIINIELQIEFNFHSLRNTHTTMLSESGVNIKHIQDRLEHSKLSTTMDLYSYVTAKIQNSTANILENIINTKIKLPPN